MFEEFSTEVNSWDDHRLCFAIPRLGGPMGLGRHVTQSMQKAQNPSVFYLLASTGDTPPRMASHPEDVSLNTDLPLVKGKGLLE